MIDHLHIKNFLAFPELDVPELKLINLVAGKNTAGKTSLLQALQFDYDTDKNNVVEIIKSLRNTTNTGLFNVLGESDFDDVNFQINDHGLEERSIVVEYVDPEGGFHEYDEGYPHQKSIYISPRSNYNKLVDLWKNVSLTSKELEVIDIINTALSISISRISVLDNEVKVLLEGEDLPVQIESLGDGAKRLLLLGLTLTQAKNGLLLIDEIETHLHHSVIRKLWKIIFEYAIKWNIQVVATTHSQDAIREFWYEAATKEDYQKVGQVLRLQIGREGKHEVIQYPFERLDSVLGMEMEIR